ncbi:MAG: 2-hydroxymuconic semialdehyde dehydrogenase [Gammaproteobacteria bacterium]|nr:MAG: 2-hydroxymuconic semialdehyde dehydrogenase [Gammaproteobacteria bacterium]
METIANFVDGQFLSTHNRLILESINPSTGEVYSACVESTSEDLERAVAASQASFSEWSLMPVEVRADFLIRIADQIDQQAQSLALAESIDNGKPLSLALSIDIPRASANLRFFASAVTQFSSECHAMQDQAFNYTLRSPIGTVACISPWNLPLYLFTWKIAPALACGNCVIAKPSELTPMTAFLLAKICQQVGLPKGVLNILHGSGASIGQQICEHPNIKAISFTGGSKTGQSIAQTAAKHFKKVSLELGGKNPALVFDDCNLEQTVQQLVNACFANQGQICLCPSRLYVHESIYAAFKELFVAKASALIVGDPLDSGSAQGALCSYAHLQKILRHVETAQHEGATLLCGGHQVHLSGRCENGFFMQPTVFENLSNDSNTNQQEIFGPVVTLQPFTCDQQALDLANQSDYGLSATLWTDNLSRAHQIARSIEAGIVWINCWLVRDLRTPFGGMKMSGVGTEGGLEVLRFFTETKNICVKY